MKCDYPLVSIALLAYNHEQYIEDNLLGLLKQDYPNMELIILDDASGDRTVEIIESWMEKLKEKFGKVVFFKNKKNSGNIPYNVNRMLKEAEGVFCKSISGDDIMADNCIAKLVQCLIDNPQCSVAYSNQYIVGDDYKRGDEIHSSNQFYIHRKSEIETKDLFRKLMFGNCIAAPSAMIKREVFEKLGFYDESMIYEDYEFWIRVAYHGGLFYYLNECLVYYRRGNSSLTNYSSEESKRKIRTSMAAVGKTLKKYFHYLSKEDQKKCKELYYRSHLELCRDAKFWRGTFAILYQMKRNKFSNPGLEEANQHSDKHLSLFLMMNQWVKIKQEGKSLVSYFEKKSYKRIAIYGMSYAGETLLDELKGTGIEVAYAIDKNSDNIYTNINIVSAEDSLEEVDVIVVTAITFFDEIRQQLASKVTCPIVSLEDILYEV